MQFESDLTVHLSKHTLETLRMARDGGYMVPHATATEWITREIMAQGLWPGLSFAGSEGCEGSSDPAARSQGAT